jgi:hypothetical protein
VTKLSFCTLKHHHSISRCINHVSSIHRYQDLRPFRPDLQPYSFFEQNTHGLTDLTQVKNALAFISGEAPKPLSKWKPYAALFAAVFADHPDLFKYVAPEAIAVEELLPALDVEEEEVAIEIKEVKMLTDSLTSHVSGSRRSGSRVSERQSDVGLEEGSRRSVGRRSSVKNVREVEDVQVEMVGQLEIENVAVADQPVEEAVVMEMNAQIEPENVEFSGDVARPVEEPVAVDMNAQIEPEVAPVVYLTFDEQEKRRLASQIALYQPDRED